MLGAVRAAAYAAMDDVQLVGIADPMPARQRCAELLCPGVPLHVTATELVAGTQPDVLDICSPPVYHEEQIRLGLEHLCHVLCEKPLVTHAEALPPLARLAQASGCVLYPAHNYNFSPAMRFLEDALGSDAVGKLSGGEFRIVRTGHARGVEEWRPDWRRDRLIAGGGILADHGTHCVYMANRLAGAWPEAASCTVWRANPDAAEERAVLRFEAGAVEWTVDLTWAGDARRNRYELRGSQGVAVVDDDVGQIIGNGLSRIEPLASASGDSTHEAWFPAMFAHFRRALEQPELAQGLLVEAAATAIVIDRAYESAAASGTLVGIDLPAFCEIGR